MANKGMEDFYWIVKESLDSQGSSFRFLLCYSYLIVFCLHIVQGVVDLPVNLDQTKHSSCYFHDQCYFLRKNIFLWWKLQSTAFFSNKKATKISIVICHVLHTIFKFIYNLYSFLCYFS